MNTARPYEVAFLVGFLAIIASIFGFSMLLLQLFAAR